MESKLRALTNRSYNDLQQVNVVAGLHVKKESKRHEARNEWRRPQKCVGPVQKFAHLNTNSEWSRAKSAPAERQLVNRLFLLCPQINLFMACKIEARLTNIGDPIAKRPKFWKPPPYDLLIENSACSLSFPVDRDESLCRWFAKNRQINRATIQLHTSTWRHDKNSL